MLRMKGSGFLSELALYCLPLIVLLEETLTGEWSA